MIREIPLPVEKYTLSGLLASPPASVRSFVFSTLIRVIHTASLESLLDQSGPFTVFAPNDGAFAGMSNEEFDNLVEPKHEPWLVEVITCHIVPGHWTAASLSNRTFRAVNGERIKVRQRGAQIMVNSARILTADIPARNGLVHEIDQVLLPAREEGSRARKVIHR